MGSKSIKLPKTKDRKQMHLTPTVLILKTDSEYRVKKEKAQLYVSKESQKKGGRNFSETQKQLNLCIKEVLIQN